MRVICRHSNHREITGIRDVQALRWRGWTKGEGITMPSVQDMGLFEAYDSARTKLYAGSRTGQPASRYTART